MNKTVSIIISWFLVALTMIIIFNFSAETATESTETSKGVVVQVLDIFMEKEEITPPVIAEYHLPIRKLAHFGIYMLLGFCMLNAFEKSFRIKLWQNSVYAVIMCSLYATTDELHQNFAEGRGPQITDVLIDSAGALLGSLIFVALLLLYQKIIFVKLSKRNRLYN
ncbi:MAG: VanZ family protein [Ruminococcaceae bacterium]|nr:VanZ family protein [Oscillospiraceae bacterium]